MRGAIFLAVGIALLSAVLVPTTRAQPPNQITPRPSFDCTKASNQIEQAICSDNTLAQWDAHMGRLYAQVRSIQASQIAISEQRQWIALRQSKCNLSDPGLIKSCVLNMTKARVGEFTTVIMASGLNPISTLTPSSQPSSTTADPTARCQSIADAQRRVICLNDLGQQKSDAWPQAARQDNSAYIAQREYRPITFEDFKLDGKGLAMAESNVAIAGLYLKVGQVEHLFSSILTTGMIDAGRQSTDSGIGLLTEDADRNARKVFLRCQNDPVLARMGCSLTVLGRATMCTSTTLVGSTKVPCVVVENIK